jgi:hypothetical protein
MPHTFPIAAIPCNCEAQHADLGSEAAEEHNYDCAYRPMCVDSMCPNHGMPMTIVEDDAEAALYGGYRCPMQSVGDRRHDVARIC